MRSYEGKQVRLRPLKYDDKQHSLVWRNDPSIRELAQGYRFPVTEMMEDKWYDEVLAGQSQKRVVYAIETLQDCTLIGFVYLQQIDWIARLGYYGIAIGDKSYHGERGKAIALEASHIFFEYVFDVLNLRKICAEVAAYNIHVLGFTRTLGFVEEGRLKAQQYYKARYHDVVLYGLFAEQYRERDKLL